MFKITCVERAVRIIFEKYSQFLYHHSLLLISLPLACTVCCAFGFLNFTFIQDKEYLFTPATSHAVNERSLVRRLFPVNYERVMMNRLTEVSQRQVTVIVIARDGGNVLRSEVMEEILQFDSFIQSVTVSSASSEAVYYNFTSLCGRWNGVCVGNDGLKYYRTQRRINLTGDVKFPYPYGSLPNGQTFTMEPFLGDGHHNGKVYFSAKAIRLVYLLQQSPEDDSTLSEKWEDEAIKQYKLFHTNLIRPIAFSSDALDEAQRELVLHVLPYLYLTCFLLLFFAMLTCMMFKDNVQSKPLLGFIGVVSPCLAVISSIGLLSLVGMEFNSIVVSCPFLVIGKHSQPILHCLWAKGKTGKAMARGITNWQ